MAQRLSEIEPEEISLVTRPANRRGFLFRKAEADIDQALADVLGEPAGDEAEAVAELVKAGADEDEIKLAIGARRLNGALSRDVLKTMYGEELVALLIPSAAKPTAPADSTEPMADDVTKNEDPATPEPESETPVDPEEEKAPPAPVQKDDGSWDLTGVPAESRPFFEQIAKREQDLRAELAKRDERLEEAERIAKAERDQRLTKEYIAKAEDLQPLPLAPAEFGLVLKEIAEKTTAETFEKLETVLKSAAEVVRQGAMFSELGGDGPGSPTDAETKIDKAAEEIRKADSKLSKEQAIDKALQENPDLYASYLRERG